MTEAGAAAHDVAAPACPTRTHAPLAAGKFSKKIAD